MIPAIKMNGARPQRIEAPSCPVKFHAVVLTPCHCVTMVGTKATANNTEIRIIIKTVGKFLTFKELMFSLFTSIHLLHTKYEMSQHILLS